MSAYIYTQLSIVHVYMPTIFRNRDGVVFVHTNVILPRYLREFARQNRISMSGLLRQCLEEKMFALGGNGP